jgi:hypothetical protein
LSLNFPTAVNCSLLPEPIVGLAGEMVIDCSVALVTDNEAAPNVFANRAVIVALPTPTPVAWPFVPPMLLTVAVVTGVDVQVTDCVRSC